MFERAEVVFPQKAVLTSAMLSELRNYPDDYFRLSLKNHSDGIVAGLEYEQIDEDLHLASGILKWHGDIYFLKEKINISALMVSAISGKTYYLYLDASEDKSRQDCINYRQIKIRVSDHKEDGLSLGRVFMHGKNKLTLPVLNLGSSDPFDDFWSDAKFNLLDVYYSAIGEPTFHPYIFTAIKNFLYQKKQKTMMDYSIMVQLQSSLVLDIDTIKFYINDALANSDDSAKASVSQAEPSDREKLFKLFARWLKVSRQKVFVGVENTDNSQTIQQRKHTSTGKQI